MAASTPVAPASELLVPPRQRLNPDEWLMRGLTVAVGA